METEQPIAKETNRKNELFNNLEKHKAIVTTKAIGVEKVI